jgi:enamine deaminase RidA (YjgF/YER057c/UK114 family)
MNTLLLIIVLLMSSVTAVHAQTVDYDKKLKELGIELPSAATPAANYVKAVRVGDVLYLSGQAAVSVLATLTRESTLALRSGWVPCRSTLRSRSIS